MLRSAPVAALLLASAAVAQAPVQAPTPAAPVPAPTPAVPVPAAITADGVPAIPLALADRLRPYLENRSASFRDWDPVTKGALVSTRFGNAAQLHLVKTPLAARTQISFEAEPIGGGEYAPDGSVLLVSKDRGGDEFYQLHRLEQGRLTLLTDGRSRNGGAVWSHDGALVGYSSTRRNGRDSDLYVMDPRNPATNRLVLQVDGGGWSFSDFAADGKSAIVTRYVSIQQSEVHRLDLATGALTRLDPADAPASWDNARLLPDGRVLVLADAGSDVRQLGVLAGGRFTPLTSGPHEVEEFDTARNGRFIAIIRNVDGISRLELLAPGDGRVIRTASLPPGVAGGLKIAPWGAVGFTFTSATSPADAWSLDPDTGALTRWTQSETGGLDPAGNAQPTLEVVESFDGTRVSGFLHQPDARKFPGPRPVIINIHGGPEGQSRPGYIGATNFLVNELGIAVFYPNVRGSTGYGKRFVSLDNGPFKREDSVKDIGAFITALGQRASIDRRRIAVTGGSYGGYMCYASAIAYGAQLKSALCTVAISNFVTFLENTQSYRRDLRRVEYGDERDPVQRAQLMKISPLTRANELKIPLMVVTGGNDPRVPASEADQMIAAVRANGTRVWHVRAANEGHGFRKKENVDYNTLASLMFWQDTLLK